MQRYITGNFIRLVVVGAIAFTAQAQWLNYPTPGIPRTADGKPNLTAPAPRKPDGRPDLSGIWQMDQNGARYGGNLLANFKPGELPIQPWAESVTKVNEAHASEYPPTHCLPPSIPVLDMISLEYPLKIVQEPDLVVILYETMWTFRQIFLDGRTLLKDPNPNWMGYSVGRWEGDALVIDTAGFNGKIWLEGAGGAGHPSTEALHITERFRRRDFGHLDLSLTIDDPQAYTRQWTVTVTMHISLDNELIEYVCNENERDVRHLSGK